MFITINSTIGAGILGLPGKVYALLGPYSVLACLAGGVLMGLVAATYAEAASRYPGTGGTILYARGAFGPTAGFAAGWLAVATRLFAYASITNLLIAYLAGLLPVAATPVGRVVVITAITWALGAIIYAGVKLSAKANALFTLVKLALLGGFGAAGLLVLRHVTLPPWPALPPAQNFAPGLVLMLFGLIGMDSAVVNGQEMRNPRAAIPFGLGVGMITVVILYALILLVCAAVVPDLAHAKRPLFDGAVAMLGAPGGVIIAAGAVISMTGTLFTILFVGPRLLFALATENQLPRALASIHPEFGTPAAAVLVHTAIAWILTITSSFLGALTASTLTRLMLYGLTAGSLLWLRRQKRSETTTPLLLPAGGAMALAACVLCLWLMTQSDRAAWISTLWCLAFGVIVGAVYLRK